MNLIDVDQQSVLDNCKFSIQLHILEKVSANESDILALGFFNLKFL